MLVDHLYSIEQSTLEQSIIRSRLLVDAAHPVFKGHFPDVPVLPGVCMIQCVKELIETSLQVKASIDKADMIKFLSMLNPVESNVIDAEIVIRERTEAGLVFQASLKNADRFLLKYSGSLLFVQ
ncbi:MAG: hydroxymyristoyl-ACP dehydratase [Cytophaga sp.]|uniref:hydroxymyristoyl-ACP dehydratase n=1 Tax=Cytophaga sp. TaxID=29535 RepID=UPI003F7D2A84